MEQPVAANQDMPVAYGALYGSIYTMINAIKTTIDRAGRIVIPKSIREGAGLVPGEPLVVSLRNGQVEIAPAPREVQLVKKGNILVAVSGTEGGALTNDTVNKTRNDLRGRRG